MCGIISIFGTDCFEYLINGLKQLQNRGYDSAGICGVTKDRKWVIHKYASTENINALKELLMELLILGGQLMGLRLIKILILILVSQVYFQ